MRGAGNARRHQRVALEFDVELEFDGVRQAGHVTDISLGGAFVETDPCPCVGARSTLRISLPGVPGTSEIPSVVRWCKDDRGVGLQFLALRPIEVWAVSRILRSAGESTAHE